MLGCSRDVYLLISGLRVEPSPENKVLSSQDDLQGSVTLSCRLYNPPRITELRAQWVVQNGEGTQIVNYGVRRNKYTAPVMIEGLMLLIIDGLSYKHNGDYTCRAKNVSDVLSNYESATVT